MKMNVVMLAACMNNQKVYIQSHSIVTQSGENDGLRGLGMCWRKFNFTNELFPNKDKDLLWKKRRLRLFPVQY